MKLLLILLLYILSPCIVQAQDYKQEGTTFVQTTSKSSSKATKTGYTWEKDGIKYPIYVSSKGKAYIIRTSKKTGNKYNKYLDEEISIKLSKEYNITYIPKQKKS